MIALSLTRTRCGFTLVELAIVLSIIALLAGGIVTGRGIIKSAELRSVMTDANKYIAGLQNFNSQYRGLPGDIPNAVNYWSGAVNGNGDGQITAVAGSVELFQFWYQLSQAGLIEQNMSGVAGPGGTNDFVLGTNIPKTRIANGGVAAYYLNQSTTSSSKFVMNYGNTLSIGRDLGANVGPPYGGLFNQADAYLIDSKIDDGMPGSGKWVATGGNFVPASACTNAATGGSDYGATYNVGISQDGVGKCGFFVITGF